MEQDQQQQQQQQQNKYVESLIQTLTDQRNAALNQAAQIAADNRMLSERLKELMEQGNQPKGELAGKVVS